MSDIIKLLPDSVANQIAAGEVIQRPASVIKELIENAVDAHASRIDIYIKDAGKTLIQVIDDGIGMSETDARLAFERHATSKIRKADDLFSLQTMGFRGEALPSICAISQVELKTKRKDDKFGTQLIINGSKVENQEPCICSNGSNFMIKNLFFNVPARRKFLKSDNVELGNIMREFERLALVNNDIYMTIDTGSTSKKIELRPGTFKQRISDLWKNNLNMHLLPIDIDTSVVKISGFISRPEFARRRNPLQFLIANGRNMRHPYFHKAIISCYEGLIAHDSQPCYFLKINVDPETIDVNIHPTKSEIKFENEQNIWSILQASVKASLGKFSAVPSIDFNEDIMQIDPPRTGDFIEKPTIDIDPSYNPFKNESYSNFSQNYSKPKIAPSYKATKVNSNWDKLYNDFIHSNPSTNIDIVQQISNDPLPEIDDNDEIAPLCIQLNNKYIITPSQNGISIIDQHRAHLKILFEQYIKNVSTATISSQRIMFPESIELDKTQQLLLESIEDELKHMGFMLEYEEDNRWIIQGMPTTLDKQNPKDTILQILDALDSESPDYGFENPDILTTTISKIAFLMARTAAIKGGTKLSISEMEHLISELFKLHNPQYTPNGKAIIRTIDITHIQSLFK